MRDGQLGTGRSMVLGVIKMALYAMCVYIISVISPGGIIFELYSEIDI